MHEIKDQLRKAALLVRSVDADTAATLLAQLSPEEAAAVREAIRSLGPVDSDEQADLLAEFRRSSTTAAAKPLSSHRGGVELSLSSSSNATNQAETLAAMAAAESGRETGKRFEFLEDAPIRSLVPYLAREHAQTVAVVLSHLEPARAAAVLAELPQALQAETLERLSSLGETDAETVRVLEHELAAWMKQRATVSNDRTGRKDTVASILSAADAKTRDQILSSVKSHNATRAEQLHLKRPKRELGRSHSRIDTPPPATQVRETDTYQVIAQRVQAPRRPLPRPLLPPPCPKPIDFDDLIHLDGRALARLLQSADPNVLALALAGSREELVDRICDQMPKRISKSFRRELRRLGPTRLSDVEAAQRAIAQLAAIQLTERRLTFAGAQI
jgi:flagellar motor switch protein FliG